MIKKAGNPEGWKRPAETEMIRGPIVNVAEKAYIAGIIDGEGTVTLVLKHSNETHSPEISVANTDIELLQWLKKKPNSMLC